MKSKLPLLMLFVVLNILFSNVLNSDNFCFESFSPEIPQFEVETFNSNQTLDKITLKKISNVVENFCPQFFVKKLSTNVLFTRILFKPSYLNFIPSSYLLSGADIFQEISSHA